MKARRFIISYQNGGYKRPQTFKRQNDPGVLSTCLCDSGGLQSTEIHLCFSSSQGKWDLVALSGLEAALGFVWPWVGGCCCGYSTQLLSAGEHSTGGR